jgi:hypothetical protein
MEDPKPKPPDLSRKHSYLSFFSLYYQLVYTRNFLAPSLTWFYTHARASFSWTSAADACLPVQMPSSFGYRRSLCVLSLLQSLQPL